ncbi:hypothetical protein BYT27DRAFT_7111290 [Phlegmacium glaucopus]|nr:hypothetical protein BYT27DRAFT_7111290 [Phlegmacium glaucopus]
MIFLFIVLYSLSLHCNVLAGPLHATFESSFYPREIDSNKPTQRSEWNIIWSCFATLFACAWISVHPNIPAPLDSSTRIFVRRLTIMACTLIAPEMLIVWAARQWYAAHDIAKRNKYRGWTTTHGFFASMGGFMLYKDGVMTENLEIEKLETLVAEGKIDWPTISEKDIQDRSKGDSFSKGFAVLQTTWFISQCIARGVVGLILTELELTTLAFSVLNAILYFLWWNKPLAVSCPVAIHLRPGMPTTDLEYGGTTGQDKQGQKDGFTISTPFQRNPSALMRFCTYIREELKDRGLFSLIIIFIKKPFHIMLDPIIFMSFGCISGAHPDPLSVSTFYAPFTLRDNLSSELNFGNPNRARLIGTGIGILFGGIHCIAWSFRFPSVAEQYIWRISAVNITVLPIIIATIFTVSYIRHKLIPYAAAYWLSRVVLLILPLLALRSLPPEALLDLKWTVFIPHI